MRRNQLLLKNLKATTSLTQTRQYFHINSFNYSFTRKVIIIQNYNHSKLTSLFPISFISLKASLAILAAIPMNTPLAEPFTSKTFTDSKPPKLEILPPTLTGQQKDSHVFWRFWKYGKIKLSPISVFRLRNVLNIAVL